MLTGIPGMPFNEQGNSRMVRSLFGATRWNQYVRNWHVVLSALRQLWEVGKVYELKSPFYEPFEKPTNR
jgi:hypothetical protein